MQALDSGGGIFPRDGLELVIKKLLSILEILLRSLPATAQRRAYLPTLLQSTNLSLNDMPLMLDLFPNGQDNYHRKRRFQDI